MADENKKVTLSDLSTEDKRRLLEEALLEQKEKEREAKDSRIKDVFAAQLGSMKEFRVVLASRNMMWSAESFANEEELPEDAKFTLNILNPDQLVSPVINLKHPAVPAIRRAVNKAILRVVKPDHKEVYSEGKRVDKGSVRIKLDTPDTLEAGRILSLEDSKALTEIDKVGNIGTLSYMLDSERQGKNLVSRTRTNILAAIHDRIRAITNSSGSMVKMSDVVEEEEK